MLTFAYPAKFARDESGRVLVSFPDFPGAHTDGADWAEALSEASDCLGSAIAFRMVDKAEVPKPSAPKRGQRMVPVPLWIAAKLALHWAVRESGVTQTELARRLGVRETMVRRMLDPHHASRAEGLHAALAVLGKRVVMGWEDAA
jgi:antitoxin HicB